jgi:lysophospholipase L1-like esterase
MAATAQILAFLPLAETAQTNQWIFFIFLELLCLSLLGVLKYPNYAILIGVVWIFTAINIFTPLVISDFGYISLPPNSRIKVQVVGDVMPGFSGIASVTTDIMGFRTSGKIDYNMKPPGTIRILAIGGSTTEQIYLDDHKTWTYLLEQKLKESLKKEVEIINTGVSGLRAKHHLRTLSALTKYDIDVAIFLVGLNDWNWHIKSALSPINTAFLEAIRMDESFLWNVGKIISRLISSRRTNALDRVEDGAFYASQNDSLKRNIKKRLDISTVSSQYRRELYRIFEVCDDKSILCIFVDQPSAYDENITDDLRRRLWMTPPYETYTLSLRNMAEIAKVYNSWLLKQPANDNIKFCPVSKYFAPTTEFFYDDCHFNEGGARAMARFLAPCIRENIARRIGEE